MNSKVDLHIHSAYSDGSDTIEELSGKIKEAGLETVALTDHDTLSGIGALRISLGEEIRFITGIEFSGEGEDGECHILGYGFDEKSPAILAAVEHASRLRKQKMAVRLKYIKENFAISLTEEEKASLEALNSAGKPHLAKILIQKGYATTISEAIKKYINGAPGSASRIPTGEAIEAISKAGGVAVWAHPFGGEGEKMLERKQLERRLAYLKEQKIKGMECYYSRYAVERSDFLIREAEKHGFFISGGSDYHGKNKNIDLGQLSLTGDKIFPGQLTVLDRLG